MSQMSASTSTVPSRTGPMPSVQGAHWVPPVYETSPGYAAYGAPSGLAQQPHPEYVASQYRASAGYQDPHAPFAVQYAPPGPYQGPYYPQQQYPQQHYSGYSSQWQQPQPQLTAIDVVSIMEARDRDSRRRRRSSVSSTPPRRRKRPRRSRSPGSPRRRLYRSPDSRSRSGSSRRSYSRRGSTPRRDYSPPRLSPQRDVGDISDVPGRYSPNSHLMHCYGEDTPLSSTHPVEAVSEIPVPDRPSGFTQESGKGSDFTQAEKGSTCSDAYNARISECIQESVLESVAKGSCNVTGTVPSREYSAAEILAHRVRMVIQFAKAEDPNSDFDITDPVTCKLLPSLFPDEVVVADLRSQEPRPPTGALLPPAPAAAVSATVSAPPAAQPVAALATAQASRVIVPDEDTPEPEDTEAAKKRFKSRLKHVLKDGLPLTGVSPAVIKPEVRRAKAPEDEDFSLSGTPKPKEDLLGWPQHKLWRSHNEALTAMGEGALRDPKRQLDAESWTLQDYVRIDDTTMARQEPAFLWRHGKMSGDDIKMPKTADPLHVSQTGERKTVTVKLADLRTLNSRNRQLVQYTNVLCHSVDILHQLAIKSADSLDLESRTLTEDTLCIAKRTLNNMMGCQVATNLSHVMYERHLLLDRDVRREMPTLKSQYKAQAMMAPNDSSTYVFGSERFALEKHIKDHLDDQKRPVYTQSRPQAEKTPAAKKQSFPAGNSTPAAKKQQNKQQSAPQADKGTGQRAGGGNKKKKRSTPSAKGSGGNAATK